MSPDEYRAQLYERMMQDPSFAPADMPVQESAGGFMGASPEDMAHARAFAAGAPPPPPMPEGPIGNAHGAPVHNAPSGLAAWKSVPYQEPAQPSAPSASPSPAALPQLPQAQGSQGSDASISISSDMLTPTQYRMGSAGRTVEAPTVGQKSAEHMGNAFESQRQGANEANDIRTAYGESMQGDIEVQKSQILEAQIAQAKAAEARRIELEKRQADIDADAKAVADQKIDPNHFFASKGAFGITASVIAAIVGGFAQGWSGSKNNAGLDAVNSMIDRDIQSQRFAHDAKLKSLDQKKSAFGVAMQRYGDADTAENMSRVYMLDQFRSDAEGRMLKEKTEEGRAKWREYIAGLDAQKEQYKANTLKLQTIGGAQGKGYVPGIGWLTDKQLTDLNMERYKSEHASGLRIGEKQAEEKAKGGDEARLVDLGDGTYYKARSAEEAIKLDAQRRELAESKGAVKAVQDASSKVGILDKAAAKLNYDTEDMARLKGRQRALEFNVAKQGGGVVTEPDKEDARNRIGDQTKIFNSDAEKAKLEEVAKANAEKEAILDRGRTPTRRTPSSFKGSK